MDETIVPDRRRRDPLESTVVFDNSHKWESAKDKVIADMREQLAKQKKELEESTRRERVLAQQNKELEAAAKSSSSKVDEVAPLASARPSALAGSGGLSNSDWMRSGPSAVPPVKKADSSSSLFDNRQQLESASIEYASVLVVGPGSGVGTFLQHQKHAVTEADPGEATAVLQRGGGYDVLLTHADTYAALASNGGAFLPSLRKHQPYCIVLTFRLDKDFTQSLKEIDINRSGARSIMQELVKAQATAFLQSAWLSASHLRTSGDRESSTRLTKSASMLEPVRRDSVDLLRDSGERLPLERGDRTARLPSLPPGTQPLAVSPSAAVASDVFLAAAESELRSLRRLVAELTAAKAESDDETGKLRERVSQLSAKLAIADFQQNLSHQSPAAALHREFSRGLGHGDLLLSRASESRSKDFRSLQWVDNPLEAAVRVFMVLLKDPYYKDIHAFLESSLQSLSGLKVQPQELEQMFQSSGVDPATQTYLMYEFSRTKRPDSRRRNSIHALPEMPLELAYVADKNVVNDWHLWPYDYTAEELITLYMYMLDQLGVMQFYNVPRNNMIRFCRALVKLYHSKNPYHTFTHAFDVAQLCFKLLHQTNARDYLTELDIFSVMVAAIAHDVDHPGYNNAFQIIDRTPLAMIYNDQSPLENHHASRLFYITSSAENNIFAGMDPGTYMASRRIVIQAILHTDMTLHFDLVAKFNTALAGNLFGERTPESRQLLINLLLHTADISNVTRPWTVSKLWSDRVLDEFFMQGDLEKERGYPVSALMNREDTDQNKMSVGFIDFIVAPAVAALASVLTAGSTMASTMQVNRGYWDRLRNGAALADIDAEASREQQQQQQQEQEQQQGQPLRTSRPSIRIEIPSPPGTAPKTDLPGTVRSPPIATARSSGTALSSTPPPAAPNGSGKPPTPPTPPPTSPPLAARDLGVAGEKMSARGNGFPSVRTATTNPGSPSKSAEGVEPTPRVSAASPKNDATIVASPERRLGRSVSVPVAVDPSFLASMEAAESLQSIAAPRPPSRVVRIVRRPSGDAVMEHESGALGASGSPPTPKPPAANAGPLSAGLVKPSGFQAGVKPVTPMAGTRAALQVPGALMSMPGQIVDSGPSTSRASSDWLPKRAPTPSGNPSLRNSASLPGIGITKSSPGGQ